jgi:hypothetical protein
MSTQWWLAVGLWSNVCWLTLSGSRPLALEFAGPAVAAENAEMDLSETEMLDMVVSARLKLGARPAASPHLRHALETLTPQQVAGRTATLFAGVQQLEDGEYAHACVAFEAALATAESAGCSTKLAAEVRQQLQEARELAAGVADAGAAEAQVEEGPVVAPRSPPGGAVEGGRDEEVTSATVVGGVSTPDLGAAGAVECGRVPVHPGSWAASFLNRPRLCSARIGAPAHASAPTAHAEEDRQRAPARACGHGPSRHAPAPLLPPLLRRINRGVP